MKREAYLDTKNTKYEARNSKQYQNLNDPNSKLCLDYQIMVYGRVSADTKMCPSITSTRLSIITLRTTTCGSPLYLSPTGGLSWLVVSI